MPTINLTAGNDSLTGTNQADVIYGLEGDDFIDGIDGDDTIYGGPGDDDIRGGLGFNLIYGDDGNDFVFGGSDNETIYGGQGNDTLLGAIGDDRLFGDDGNDIVQGGTGNDSVVGGAGDDQISGGVGLDTLDGGLGNDRVGFETLNDGLLDVLLGGDGDDFVYFNTGDNANGGAGNDVGVLMLRNVAGGAGNVANTANMTFDLSQANMNVVASGLIGGTVTGFERWGVYTGAGNDSITGSATGDLLNAFNGTDTINGGGGDDTIIHNSGAALLTGGTGGDVFIFNTSDGNDTITDYSLADDDIDFFDDYLIETVNVIDADADGAVDDTVVTWKTNAAANSATLNLLNAAISLTASAQTDFLQMSATSFVPVDAMAGNDSIIGTSHDDAILGGAGRDRVWGGDGYDSIDGGTDNDILFGGAGNDLLSGGDGNDRLFGGVDSDILIGGLGADFMVGGDGDDQYFVDDVGDIVVEYQSTFPENQVQSTISYTLDKFVASLILLGTANIDGTGNNTANALDGNDGNNRLRGLNGNDAMRGYAGNDTLEGGEGNDNLEGGAGQNTLDGGAGNDTAYLRGDTVGAYVNLASFSMGASFTGQIGSNYLVSIETLNVFGEGNDTLIGTAGTDVIYAQGGNDLIFTGDGIDFIYGGNGNDVISLGSGNDIADTGNGVVEFGDPDITSELDYVYAGLGDDQINGSGAGTDVMLGQEGNDILYDGRGAFSYLFGGSGNNTMTGLAQVNVFLSEGGSDTMTGGNVAFYYRLADGASSVTGSSGIDQFIGGNALSNDSVFGADGDDFLFGGNGNDLLVGGNGNDVIIGQGGTDTLDGGRGVNLLWANDAGSDQILVNVADGGTQVVDYFEAGGTNDVVRILGSSLTSFAGIQNLVNNLGTVQGNNLMVNVSFGSQLYLNVGANQTAIWFQGINAYSLTSADFVFG